MLICSMGVSVDGYIADRDGNFNWSEPDDELFAFHLETVGSLGACLLGRKLHESMIVWETDPSMRSSPAYIEFADVWTALPKVVFSRTLDRVEGNSRLADRPLGDEIAGVLASTDRDVEIGGAGLIASAMELGFVDEFRLFRYPVIVGGGTPLLPPVTEDIALELVDVRRFGPVIFEQYRRAGA